MDEPLDQIFETVAATAGDVLSILGTRRSYEEGQNPSGEQQLAADVYADEQLEEKLLDIPAVGSYASEERDEIVEDSGEYHIACDPLDGSSNLKPNNGMGTIIAVYDEPAPAPGEALVGAAYVLYGPTTTMITAADGTVTEYLIEDGERSILDEDVTVPDDPVVYGFGGRAPDWTDDFAAFVEEIESRRLKLRYGGAMVADVNQVLTYGGIFGYPMLDDRPEGKLRLQFEGHPIAAIVSMAGGASTDGTQSLLSKTPGHIHERTPLFVGTESLIDDLEAALDE
ncbi:class 1 fructose-bisphosphatase [Halovenus sp. HT40]|uniref:class 1 fructose-bisphosphatase n=1 Tax=Halovenus sp. HT40 TaxID=3126691 RepID=UPI00300EFB4E